MKREKPSHNGTVQLKLDEKLQKRTNTYTNIHTVLFKLPSEYAKDMRPLNVHEFKRVIFVCIVQTFSTYRRFNSKIKHLNCERILTEMKNRVERENKMAEFIVAQNINLHYIKCSLYWLTRRLNAIYFM